MPLADPQKRAADLDPSSDPVLAGASADRVVTADASLAPAGAPTLTVSARYFLGGEISRGGMGVIYRATDTVLSREVAVKVLHEKLAPHCGAARRFGDEARITGQLQHPAIPPVHDLGALPDGRPFLAMKLIEGDTLDQLLKQSPDLAHNRGRFVAVFEQVCQAVGFAHSRGVIHRDLKPANIMVGAFGEVQVMDWGIAKELGRPEHPRPALLTESAEGTVADADETTEHRAAEDSTDDRTRAGQALGTPSFMPPEQARGEVDRVGRRSDVFALGGILCAILTGKPPIAGVAAALAIRQAAAADFAEAWSRLDANGADAELVTLCKRCLSAEPTDRPADGGAVAALVADYRADVEERLRAAERERAAAEAKAAEQRKKRRIQLALAAALVVLLAGGGAFAWHSERQASAERGRLGRNAEAVDALLDQAEAALRSGDAAKAEQLLDAAQKRAGEGGAEESADRLARLRADWAALGEADEGDRLRWTVARGRRQTAAAAVRYRAALAAVGADPLAAPPEDVADRVGRSAVQERLLAALDWVLWEERSPKVRAALLAADPDPFRTAVRDSDAADDRKGIAELAGRPVAALQPPRFVALLGEVGFVPAGTRRKLLADALRLHPANLGLLLALDYANHPEAKGVKTDRLRFAQGAVSAAPKNAIPHLELGVALANLGELDEAEIEYRTAIRLEPALVYAHNNLGKVLFLKGDIGGAAAELKEAVRLDPEYAIAHDNLGTVLDRLGDEGGAVAAFRESIRLDANRAEAHFNYGNLLYKMGDLGGAVAEYREAVRCNASFAPAHNNLGNPLHKLGDSGGAIRELREGIRLDPTRANPHNALGTIFHDLGDLDGAEAEFKEAQRLDAKNPFVAANLTRVERQRPLLPRLAGVIAGTDRPANAVEAVEFADLCRMEFQKRYARSVRLFDEAFAADSKLPGQVSAGQTRRYLAACAAIRAGCGAGADAPDDPAQLAALRAQALTWLRAELRVGQGQAASSRPADRKSAAVMADWVQDPFLGRTRSGSERLAMPPTEWAEWDALWADVRATLVEAKKPPPKLAPAPPETKRPVGSDR